MTDHPLIVASGGTGSKGLWTLAIECSAADAMESFQHDVYMHYQFTQCFLLSHAPISPADCLNTHTHFSTHLVQIYPNKLVSTNCRLEVQKTF